ncbi:dienelactone hydrolase family protein [Pseudoxanthomonas sp. LH2527]|uniref:dienelactone hydrolase family protein n=1 Tax=Pseudoxanthomonas sp. LH2527 TaxID=2923249 RepID=UPI001F148E45|nr:dienelactone hydrolase family protein [Pseudoxanthomonas sp. LH2527]MCH6484677.1 dienelactone hydrolase family protein [Pseudoxanthomonas sp. LH2527]
MTTEGNTMDEQRTPASAFDQRVLDLYDDYVHGRVDRRGFLSGAAQFAVGGTTAAALLAALAPQYAFAAQVATDDPRITTVYRTFPAPLGHGEGRGLLAMPRAEGRHPVVLVVHENRGLNPYIEDVARRLAVAGFIAFAPDALYPLGGYPGNDDAGREMQATLDRDKVMADLEAAARFADALPRSSGRLGVIGFCFGGLVTNLLASRLPDLVDAGVPYYGGQPSAEEAARIRAPLLLQFAELDARVNAGWPAYEQQLQAAGVPYTAHVYPGVNHGFHNDTTPRYDQAAAELSWQRTLAFLRQHLG